MDVVIISTGSKSIDNLIGGGVMTGLITDIFGDTKFARNAIAFSTSINFARLSNDSPAVFIDSQGSFRPEIVMNQLLSARDSVEILKRIRTLRIFSSRFLRTAIENSMLLRPRLILIDNFVLLFSGEHSPIAKHLSIMYHLRQLARIAINTDVAILITNPSVSHKVKNYHTDDQNQEQVAVQSRYLSHEEEVFGRSLSMYTDIVVKLDIVNADNSTFCAQLIKPANDALSYLRITQDFLFESEQK
jgi:RecA/RadA recombinase